MGWIFLEQWKFAYENSRHTVLYRSHTLRQIIITRKCLKDSINIFRPKYTKERNCIVQQIPRAVVVLVCEVVLENGQGKSPANTTTVQ